MTRPARLLLCTVALAAATVAHAQAPTPAPPPPLPSNELRELCAALPSVPTDGRAWRRRRNAC